MKDNVVIVTRHTSLIQLLNERGIITGDAPVVAHAKIEDVKGKHVFGVLPLSLAVWAKDVTEIPLALTPEDRGKELGIERLREIAGAPQSYTVLPGSREELNAHLQSWAAHGVGPSGPL